MTRKAAVVPGIESDPEVTMIRSPRAILMVATLGALGACSTETLPPTNTPGPTASVITTTPVVTAVPVQNGTVIDGTLVTAPGTVLVPSSGSSTVTVVSAP